MTEPAPRAHAEQAPDPARLLDYDETYLSCRDVMHAWPPRADWSWRQVAGGYARTMMCTRCHTIARDVIDARSGQGKRSYRYPEGYSMPKGQGVTRRDVRLEQLRRVVEEYEERNNR